MSQPELNSTIGLKTYGAVFGVALVLRLAVMVIVGWGKMDQELLDLGGGDGTEYFALALAIAEDGNFSHPLFILRPPGLPVVEWFLMTVTTLESPWVVMVANAFFASTTVVLATKLASILGFNRLWPVAMGIVVALEPASVFYGITPMTEPLSGLLLITTVLLAVTLARNSVAGPRRIILLSSETGLSIAALILVRPSGVGVLAVMAIASVWILRRRSYLALPILLIPLFVYTGWSAHNSEQFGTARYSNSLQYNIFFIKTPKIIKHATGTPEDESRLDLVRELENRAGESAPVDATHYDYLAENDSEKLSLMQEIALEKWVEHPSGHLRATLSGIYAHFFNMFGRMPLSLLFAPARILLYLLAIAGMVLLYRQRRFLVLWLLAATVTYFGLSNLLVLGEGDLRLSVPMYPLIVLLGTFGLEAIVKHYKKNSDARLEARTGDQESLALSVS